MSPCACFHQPPTVCQGIIHRLPDVLVRMIVHLQPLATLHDLQVIGLKKKMPESNAACAADYRIGRISWLNNAFEIDGIEKSKSPVGVFGRLADAEAVTELLEVCREMRLGGVQVFAFSDKLHGIVSRQAGF